jgi:hypothetical protein
MSIKIFGYSISKTSSEFLSNLQIIISTNMKKQKHKKGKFISRGNHQFVELAGPQSTGQGLPH